MYFGASLGRAGFDLRPHLIPAFERATLALCGRLVCDATDDCVRELQTAPLHAQPAEAVDLSASATAATSSAPPPPPALLVDYPALAALVNGYLSALNEARHCALVTIAVPIRELFAAGLARVAQVLAQPLPATTTTATAADARWLRDAFARYTVPYVARCVAALYGGAGAEVLRQAHMDTTRILARVRAAD